MRLLQIAQDSYQFKLIWSHMPAFGRCWAIFLTYFSSQHHSIKIIVLSAKLCVMRRWITNILLIYFLLSSAIKLNWWLCQRFRWYLLILDFLETKKLLPIKHVLSLSVFILKYILRTPPLPNSRNLCHAIELFSEMVRFEVFNCFDFLPKTCVLLCLWLMMMMMVVVVVMTMMIEHFL